MIRNPEMLLLASGLTLAAMMSGCRVGGLTSRPGLENVQVDPCADRLHDICGDLLHYYSVHGNLPERLLDAASGPQPALSLTCPTSGKAYVYSATGIEIPGWPGRVVVHDAEACHSGVRWGILMETPQQGKAMVIRVARLPEAAFSSQGKP